MSVLGGIGKLVGARESTLAKGVGQIADGARGRAAVPIDEFTAGFGPEEAARRYRIENPTPDDLAAMDAAHMRGEPSPSRGVRSDDWVHMPEPHTQTRAEFADDPRTWWHGRFSADLPGSASVEASGGLHLGTLKASEDRHRTLLSWEKGGGATWEAFPTRLQGRGGDAAGAGRDEGMPGHTWSRRPETHYYKNAAEDEGSISALTSSRADMKTHGEYIAEALAEGKHVDPKILHEQEMLGGRDFDPRQSGMHGPAYFSAPLAPFEKGSTARAQIVRNIENSEVVRNTVAIRADWSNAERVANYRHFYPKKRQTTVRQRTKVPKRSSARQGLLTHSSAPPGFDTPWAYKPQL
jgi:hypothetical protein